MASIDKEPSSHPISKLEFEFEKRSNTTEDLRKLIYREILEYHPIMLKEFLHGAEPTGFMYPRCSHLELLNYLLCIIMSFDINKWPSGKVVCF